MSTLADRPRLAVRTLAHLVSELGGIDPGRILLVPPPGTATVADAERYHCELIDGTLVRKAMGMQQALLTVYLIELLNAYIRTNRLGILTPPDLLMEMLPEGVRAPDAAFVSWGRIPGRRPPMVGVPVLVPDLCVEVLSPGNTRGEMLLKRGLYFRAGVRLVWEIDPRRRVAAAYRTASRGTRVPAGGSLAADDIVPGFALPLADLFAQLEVERPDTDAD